MRIPDTSADHWITIGTLGAGISEAEWLSVGPDALREARLLEIERRILALEAKSADATNA